MELTLSRNLPGSRLSCGVLICRERNLSSMGEGPRAILNMTLFKKTTAGPVTIGGSNDGQLKLLASVSSTQPNLEQVYDGMKLYGVLNNGQATLRLELSKQADCLAEYICELQVVNAKGKQMLTSSRLVQHPDQGIFNAQDLSLTSSLLMRLTSVIEQMDVKLAVMDDRSLDLKKDLIDTRTNLEKTLQSTEDKLCQLDSKLSAIDSYAIQEKVLKEMKTQIDTQFDKVLASTERTDDILNKTAKLFTTLRSNNKKFQSNTMENYQSFFGNVTRSMVEMFTRNQNQTDRMKGNFISFKNDVDLSWARLQSNANESLFKTLTVLQNIISKFNSTLDSNMKYALTDFFMPEGCKKNTPALLHPVSFPYLAIFKSEFPLDTPILCDTTTEGGGWIVIQRRSTGTVDFNRDWASYREGFGTLDNDFWLGNEKIHIITSSGVYELRVELKYQGESKFALYDRFALADEDKNYTITVGSYSGTAGDSLTYHNGHPFNTFDRDNDSGSGNCAEKYTGAWWYANIADCGYSDLNGKWGDSGWKGLNWNSLTGNNSVTFSEMKIRRVIG
ncbi:hypothetical protein RRG08_059302 [Elysia crispata]|uniref:Fibrinogen C-terminal domain-containing protein n=1 Tax=Elysia crispata TaxID=231223 RepID=A0AAE1DD99_9GAST|nr:hypothetical protein RRG08_059302 [Elysia crispata]